MKTYFLIIAFGVITSDGHLTHSNDCLYAFTCSCLRHFHGTRQNLFETGRQIQMPRNPVFYQPK